ncbi:MAG: tryptophan--tRNA ligase [Candidatus Vogelbacteria bacterium RIFOXYD1_FULL_44_32]|uniref:Tryptophan--tRNA ligase n=1 Tax=Candidatus Vogelbacteria bacterium RIFOXYD1_FULL_44_32 TaxID=1802438 RepID=A0A1G2QDI9_9BACT|nr:MAG: tryptophan--tRNA ligase [Candidatus Vogelbacteria bacterium RIFOXYD1_FULL_44_32]
MSTKKILLSGIKPTGRPHIGNYFGAMKQFVELQDAHDSFYMIANYHGLNYIQNGPEMADLTLNLAIDYLAVGLDPAKSVIFKQSDIPEHTELAWIFDTITTMPYLMRAHAFKDAEAKNKEISVGAFNYPMLMAADILIYDTDVVPVGQDQKQHVEYARDTAEKFNRIFGETFKLPEPKILEDVAVVPGLDGQKMSKSYNNTIPLFAEDNEIRALCMKIVTDSKSPDEPKDPSTDNIFALHKLFALDNLAEIETRYREGKISYKESKEILADNIIKFVTPLREKRKAIATDPAKVKAILAEGGEKARARAVAKMKDVKEKTGLSF